MIDKSQIKPIVEGQTGRQVADNLKANFDFTIDKTNEEVGKLEKAISDGGGTTDGKLTEINKKIEDNKVETDKKIEEIDYRLKGSLGSTTKQTFSVKEIKDTLFTIKGKWFAGTRLYISLIESDISYKDAYIGFKFATSEVSSVLVIKPKEEKGYFIEEDCTEVRFWTRTPTGTGNLIGVVKTKSISENSEDIEHLKDVTSEGSKNITVLNDVVTTINGDLSKKFNVSGENAYVEYNVNIPKGATVELGVFSDTALLSNISFAAVYPSGKVNNIVNPDMNDYGLYTLAENCTQIIMYASSVVKKGDAYISIKNNGSIKSIERYLDFYNLRDNILEEVAKQKVGTTIDLPIYGSWAKKTEIELSISSDDGNIKYCAVAMLYPDGEVTGVARPTLNVPQLIRLEQDCKRIRFYAPVTASGTFKISVKNEGVFTLSQKKMEGGVGILGDSYSTYFSWITKGNASWYAKEGVDGVNTEANNINSVEQTWWYMLSKEMGMPLYVNESYSGSTICNTGYNSNDATTTSFITRMKKSLGEGRTFEGRPKLIIILGGTNDSWANSPLGTLKYSGWTSTDLKKVLPAICYMFAYVKKWNPGARIINVVNNLIKQEIKTAFAEAAKYYGITNIELVGITTENSHPNIAGMHEITDQIISMV